MDEAEEEFALFLKALLFLRCRISLLVRVDFPSILLNSTFVFERVFFFLQMANGLGRSLALAAARYGRVSGQRLLLVPLLFGLLPRLARLDALVEGLALVVGYGSQILNLFHFNLLLVCHFHGFFLADLALVLGLLCEILRRVLSELAVCKLWFIVLVHPSHLVARLLLSLVLMLHELVIVVLLEAVV